MHRLTQLVSQLRPGTSLAVATLAVLLTPIWAAGQYIWNPPNNNNGRWDAANRWTGGPDGTFPDAVDATATFNIPLSSNGSGNFNVQISNTEGTNVTVGSVTVNHDDANTFSTRFGANGNGSITLQSSVGPATWTENAGSPTDSNTATNIFAPVIFGSDIVITANHAPDRNASISFGSTNNSPGGITAAPGITLTKEGPANLEFSVAPTGPGEGFQGAVVINEGGVRLEDNVLANSSSVVVNSGGQFQLGAGGAVPDWNLAPGAALTLNGPGKAGGNRPEGALRYQNPGATANFNSPVELASDSNVYVNADLAPTPPDEPSQGHLRLTQTVSGAGALQKSGDGILELTQGNSYEGGTTVDGGVLLVNNASGSATGSGDVTVQAGGTLGGSGLIAGSVSLLDGGVLAPGNSPGTLNVGALSLTAGSLLNFELDVPGVVGSDVNDLIVVGGDLTLDGTLAVGPLAGFGIGTYRLFDYQGLLSDFGLEISGVPAQFLAAIDLSVPGQVNLSVNPVPEPSSMILLGLGVVGIAVAARNRRAGKRELLA